ncbi:hypothetical protein BJV74DRAFT_981433 [Russula compacta]|nr:hypothetical protein BJV74DRAFT_981433 [Russula compacta]
MTVRPQHHRRPPSRRRRHWRRLLYNIPRVIFSTFPTFSASPPSDRIGSSNPFSPMSAAVGTLYSFPTTVVLLCSTCPYRCLFLPALPPLSSESEGAMATLGAPATAVTSVSALLTQFPMFSSVIVVSLSLLPFTCYANHHDTA